MQCCLNHVMNYAIHQVFVSTSPYLGSDPSIMVKIPLNSQASKSTASLSTSQLSHTDLKSLQNSLLSTIWPIPHVTKSYEIINLLALCLILIVSGFLVGKQNHGRVTHVNVGALVGCSNRARSTRFFLYRIQFLYHWYLGILRRPVQTWKTPGRPPKPLLLFKHASCRPISKGMIPP